MATLSGDFLMAALLIYSLAVIAFAGDFAFGRPRRSAASKVVQKRVAELATVGGPAGDAAIADVAPPEAPADVLPTGSGSAWQSIQQAGSWVRAAVLLSAG